MRCHRCHSKIDPGRKMCPVCGTLIKKPRGAFSVSRQAGGSIFGEISYSLGRLFDSVNIKIILAVICGMILMAVVMTTFRCGSCDRSGGFSSCGTPSSCAALAGVSDSCDSCNSSRAACSSSRMACVSSCDSASKCAGPRDAVSDGDVTGSDVSGGEAGGQPAADTAAVIDTEGKNGSAKDDRERPSISSVQAVPQGSSCSCAGSNDDVEAPAYELSRNSAANGREFLYRDRLYFCGSSGIYHLNSRDETGMLIKGTGINSIYIGNDRIYYLKSGELWTAAMDSPEAGECLVSTEDAEGAEGDAARIYGFGISGSDLCFWRPYGANGGGGFTIVSRSLETGVERTLYEGRCVQQQVYRGYFYFISREDSDLNTLYRVPLEGGEKQELIKLPVGYYALCDGNIFAYTWIEGEAELYKISCDTLKIDSRWDFRSIRGMTADDYNVYYYSNDADGTGSVFSIMPDGTGNKLLFSDKSVIQLNHVAGHYFSLYTGLNEEAENRYAGAPYYIIDMQSGDRRLIK